MVRLSRYTHKFDLGDSVALYHSLRMKPVYLKKDAYEGLQAWLVGPFCNDYSDAPEELKATVDELVKYKILNHSEEDDDKVLQFVRSRIPSPAINVCYMITSEQCNLACKYCFLGNNDKCKRSNFSLENMSKETADKAIDFFINQIKLSGLDSEDNKPSIIFYGGEPLVNYDVLVYIAEKINSLRENEKCVKNMELSMVSNGLLLTEERALKLKELGVSIAISVDGFTEEANSMRVDVAGNNVFNKILNTLDMCKRIGVDVSLSVTLSEETIKDTKGNVSPLKGLPKSNVLKYNLSDEKTYFIVRPSGTEPKIKLYLGTFAESFETAEKTIEKVLEDCKKQLGL